MRMSVRVLVAAICRCAVVLAAGPCRRAVPRADLPGPAAPLFRSIPGRRQHRRGGARDAAGAGENSRPAGGRREPGRRRRHAGRRRGRQGRARRLDFGLAGAGALGVNIGERTKRPYDPAKDLALISRAAGIPFILVATPSLQRQRSLADVIKLAKAEPSRMSIGHGGNGTAMQLAALMFVTMADVKINLVPYRGTAPVVTDAIAGHVQLGIADPPPSMAAHRRRASSRRIAVTSKQRFSVFPDVPTFDELGLKDFELTGWFGIVAPAATPRDDRDEAQRRGGRGAEGSRGRAPHPHRRHGADADDARGVCRLSSTARSSRRRRLQPVGDKPN